MYMYADILEPLFRDFDTYMHTYIHVHKDIHTYTYTCKDRNTYIHMRTDIHIDTCHVLHLQEGF